MTNSELKEYINNFPEDAQVYILLANPKDRKLYVPVQVFFVTGEENPILCIEVGEAKNMDEELVAACREDEDRCAVGIR